MIKEEHLRPNHYEPLRYSLYYGEMEYAVYDQLDNTIMFCHDELMHHHNMEKYIDVLNIDYAIYLSVVYKYLNKR